MNKPLIYKYKPRELIDINLNDFSKKLINSYIKNNKLLFLIYGNSCTGKTSLINIILNLYYQSDKNIKENIININLLSEQGINFYRNELKNFCQIHNIKNKKIKKTIVIDDVDFVNEQSQEIIASLIMKYKNVNFLFSCNNLNKVSEYFKNYMENININPNDEKHLINITDKIITNENIKIPDEVKKYLIAISNYCIPCILNNLNKIIIVNNNKEFEYNNKKDIVELILNINSSIFDDYVELCRNKNLESSYNILLNIFNSGFSVIDILDEFLLYIKNISILEDKHKYEIIKLLCKYINIFNNIHEDDIEIIFLTNNIIKVLNS
tara:strand:- start:468 stop:1439 length:972 start_codon:yes stop_codon:yes gene_type:complete